MCNPLHTHRGLPADLRPKGWPWLGGGSGLRNPRTYSTYSGYSTVVLPADRPNGLPWLPSRRGFRFAEPPPRLILAHRHRKSPGRTNITFWLASFFCQVSKNIEVTRYLIIVGQAIFSVPSYVHVTSTDYLWLKSNFYLLYVVIFLKKSHTK